MPVKARARFVELIKLGHIPLGVYLTSVDAATTEVFAAAGYDFVIIDCEHGPHDNASALGHIRAAEAGGVIPLVRVLENSPTLIQASLDLGAHGVIVPKVENAAHARTAVSASLYAPKGFRGMCNGCHAAGYCGLDDWAEHQCQSDENVVIFPLIETVRGVENIEEILDVPGIEFVFFGPGDLSNDMGVNLVREPEKLMPAWHKVKDAARARGKYVVSVGAFGFEDADIYAGVMDLMMLRATAAEAAKKHRAFVASRGESRQQAAMA
ncbi:HpcH/HpaI aldolase family protein [Rhizorhabdus argentea]|uniref:HpcH/HpaI aldolase family protein n=1 Tax=Rhizorhabdus argentea TaxID=1387174 RepID=UPI0030EB543D